MHTAPGPLLSAYLPVSYSYHFKGRARIYSLLYGIDRSWSTASIYHIKHFSAYVEIIFKHREVYMTVYVRESRHDSAIASQFGSSR